MAPEIRSGLPKIIAEGAQALLPAVALVLAAGMSVALTTPLSGQANVDFEGGSSWLVGYVANAPHQLLGGATVLVLPAFRGWGIYLDAKLSTNSPGDDPFLLSFSPSDAEAQGDQVFRSRSAWNSVNLAAVRPLSRELALYLGGGASRESAFTQYFDLSGERGQFGHYWVEDGVSQVRANLIGGALFRIGSRLVIQFGAERAPAGFTAGGHWLVR